MNEKTLKLLEFDAIRAAVAALAMSEEAGNFILGEEPRRDMEETKKLKSLVSAVTERMASSGGEKRDSLPDIKTLISKLEVEGAVLETDEAYAIGIFIERAEALRQWLLKPFSPEAGGRGYGSSPGEELLSKAAKELPACAEIAAEVFKVLDRDGNIRDLPEFRDIRRRIRTLQKDIDSTGSRYAKNEDTRRMLQSDLPSQRDGRLVLAVKANFRGRIRGIVHEVSSTGQTIFVEPEEVVEKNNELLIENRRLEAEIRRVFRELTGRIASRRENLETFHHGIIFLETIRARARYGFERKGVFASEEDSTDDGGKLVLLKARHPLLGSKAVPLDLAMLGGIRTVIITGPNTGGKTVALKTLGLLAMMNQFGLALPAAEGTVLPVFDGVYADIGDEQSLSQSLSTFSGHMTNIADIIGRSTSRSLVLLDELGSGTDPEEGSAIAMAILDHFIEAKTCLIVTTHHGILKNYGYTREGVENASMEFDSRTLSPTFRIVMGIPGESRAVDIAARNGFPAALVSAARSYLDEERSDVSALIAGLKEKHRELDAAAEAGRVEERRLIEERRQADLKELRLRQKELQLRSGEAGSLRALLGESRKTLENLVREVKEGELSREKTLKVKEFLSGLEERVLAEDAELERERLALAEERGRVEEGAAAASAKETAFAPGMEVLAGESRAMGRILRPDRKHAPASWIVEVGSLKMSFSEKDLVPVAARDLHPAKVAAKNTSWAAELAPSSPIGIELSLLGMRLPDALDALTRQIDAAVLGGLREFAVVHGKGDGILSKGVHDYLKKDPRVADYYFSRPEAGGFGRTDVVLK
ncbi:MAG: endonuclease MutS2 [Treponema sp.]|jgi:DNA mismatch repair protein MutS2|nr:endonuclease MutS2 [Treponema sp.]